MLKYSCQFVTFKLIGHWVIWCFWSFCFFWNNVFGHWVIWCFSQSFEQKLQPQILQPPSVQFFSLQQASLKPPSLQDSQHMSTPPNILWMLDPACWPNLPQHKDSQHMLTPPNRVWMEDTACWPNLTKHKNSQHIVNFTWLSVDKWHRLLT